MEVRNLIGSEFLNDGKELKVVDVKVEGLTVILTTKKIELIKEKEVL